MYTRRVKVVCLPVWMQRCMSMKCPKGSFVVPDGDGMNGCPCGYILKESREKDNLLFYDAKETRRVVIIGERRKKGLRSCIRRCCWSAMFPYLPVGDGRRTLLVVLESRFITR